jgi:exopolysaccharide biosynthesis polyprenyl glycosylphosphotransferase
MSRPFVARAGDAGIRVADLIALAVALPVAHQVHSAYAELGPIAPIDEFSPSLIVTLVLWIASAWLHSVYEGRPRAGASAVLRVARALSVVAIVQAAAVLLVDREYPRALAVVYFAAAFLLLAGNRAAFRLVARVARRRGYHARRYAVVGTGGLAREIVESIEAHPEWGQAFAGFILLDGARDRSRGPVLGRVSQLGRILEEKVLDEVIFAVPRDQLDSLERAILLCQEQGVDVQISLDVLRFGPANMHLRQLDGLPLLAFTRTSTDLRALAAKRAFDVLVSAAVLVVLAPLLIALAIAIRVESRGPVFFRQRRSGLNGRTFTMLKFRSMHLDAEARLEKLRAYNEMTGPVFKMANDPRITRVGRFIRKTSLDELPQFLNVLRGEMSVVGPRPPIPAEVRQYKRWQRRRLSMKPGITCSWQVSGRNEIGFDRWMELDLEYIDGWSLWKDVQICMKTIPAVISARGAH